MYVDVLGITMQHHEIFQSVTSPKVAKNQIMADFRQIMWRKSFLNLGQHYTKTYMALPHNMARPFFTFFAPVLRPSVYRQDMWQKKTDSSHAGFNTEENGSAR
jgi:hypothetical protein